MSNQDSVVSAAKSTEFSHLYQRFLAEYVETEPAQAYLARYPSLRAEAEKNYTMIVRAMARGLDSTDAVLLTLLPYADTSNNRWRGAWLHVAPTITGDIRRWYEAAGWTQPGDWPKIADSILHFVKTCVEAPHNLAAACTAFSDLAYTKGFQSGTLSPILNALRPQQFLIIHKRSRTTLNYFAETDYDHSLRTYPAANRTLLALLEQFELGPATSPSPHHAGDLFDLFSLWLTNVQEFPFRAVRYWRLQAGDDLWQWQDWRDERYIAIGWDELGDLSALPRAEYVDRRDSLVAQLPGWTRKDADQVWRFYRQLSEGDRVLITHEHPRVGPLILGASIITGPYAYFPHVPQGHRRPVQWEDLTPRQYDTKDAEYDPKRTLLEIDLEHYRASLHAPAHTQSLASLFVDASADAVSLPDFLRFCIPIIEYLAASGGSAQADDVIAAIVQDSHQAQTADSLAPVASVAAAQIQRAQRYLAKAELIQTEPDECWSLTRKGSEAELTPALIYDLFSDIEYQRRLAATLAAELPHIRRLAETAASYDHDDFADDIGDDDGGVEAPRGQRERQDSAPAFSIADAAQATGYPTDKLERWLRAVERKGQAIFYGPPGTGKTFLATKLARAIVDGGDGFIDIVQFHPAYTYEEFVQGIRPQTVGSATTYPLMPGRFLQFCARAEDCTDRCVLVIDEINRADLTQVFGELMYLLEYRGQSITLAGSDKPFGIPANVRILGTMNTADRSIALVDSALRRRFAFIEVEPDYAILRQFHSRHGTGFAVEALIALLQHINQLIGNRHYSVGISYFLRTDLAQEIGDIWQMEIEPYLSEYFIDQPQIMDDLRWSAIRAQLDTTT